MVVLCVRCKSFKPIGDADFPCSGPPPPQWLARGRAPLKLKSHTAEHVPPITWISPVVAASTLMPKHTKFAASPHAKRLAARGV